MPCYDPDPTGDRRRAPCRAPSRFAAPETTTDIEYDQIGRLLASSALAPTPSEAHGMLCGFICGAAPAPERAWLDQVLPPAAGVQADDPHTRQARAELGRLAHDTRARIEGPALGLPLLLPDDDRPLLERATALYDWVRGFLFALGVLGLGARDLSAQGREVLQDFAQITRMDLDQLREDEEHEVALTELGEFVWVAAMLIYEERVAARVAPR